jgi:hypothetical protein
MNHKDTKSTKHSGRHHWKMLLVRIFVPFVPLWLYFISFIRSRPLRLCERIFLT